MAKAEQYGSGDNARKETTEKLALVRAYKLVLKEALESRPSGIRLKIADRIGKNKSFVSQITNPRYKTPLPEKYLQPIFDVGHLTPAERKCFLEIYDRAHPRAQSRLSTPTPGEGKRILRIELPKLRSATLDRKVDALIMDFAKQINRLIDEH